MKNGHTFERPPTGIIVKLKSERSIVFPLTVNLYSRHGYWVACWTKGKACGALAPAKQPTIPVVDMTNHNCETGSPPRYYSAKTWSSKGSSSSESFWSAEGAPWQRFFEEMPSSLHNTHEQTISSAGFF